MRYILPILVLSLLFSGLSFSPTLAQGEGTTTVEDEVELPKPGLTPDSPVYFLDGLFKSVRLTFAFSSARKANLRLEFAQEKLAEAKLMADEGKEDALEEAIGRYQNHVEKTQERIEKLRDATKDRIAERVAEATAKHFSVLERVREKAPERAKEVLLRARDASESGHLEAIRALSDAKADKAAELTARALKNRVELARKKADANVSDEDDSTREVERFERFAEFAEELKTRHQDGDAVLKERIKDYLDEDETQRNINLRRVRDKVPAQAREAIDRALIKSERIRVPRGKDIIIREAGEKKEERKLEFEARKMELKERSKVKREEKKGETRDLFEEKIETKTIPPKLLERIKVDDNSGSDDGITVDDGKKIIVEDEPPEDSKKIELNDALNCDSFEKVPGSDGLIRCATDK